MNSSPTVAVIIPTFNRKESLLRTLSSLKRQTYPFERFEVVVVDDGSPDDTHTIADQQYPFTLRYLTQNNQGATAARNHGAINTEADILVFVDDDVTVSSQTLEALAATHCQVSQAIVVGTLVRRSSGQLSVFTSIVLAALDHSQAGQELSALHFIDCNTELLSCRRRDFIGLGMLQDPTGGAGWPNWDDVDFGYRAYLNGFRLLQNGNAIGEHWDYSITDRTLAFLCPAIITTTVFQTFTRSEEHLQETITTGRS